MKHLPMKALSPGCLGCPSVQLTTSDSQMFTAKERVLMFDRGLQVHAPRVAVQGPAQAQRQVIVLALCTFTAGCLGALYLSTSALNLLVAAPIVTDSGSTLDRLLEPNLQRSIASSVARGMAHLHSRNPPILHLVRRICWLMFAHLTSSARLIFHVAAMYLWPHPEKLRCVCRTSNPPTS